MMERFKYVVGDMICAKKAAHSNRLKCYYIIDWISLLL